MIRATPPRGKPIRTWVCVWCDAHGEADSEEEQRALARGHLKACATRIEHDRRLDAALAVLESER